MTLMLEIVLKLWIVKALEAQAQNSRCGKHFWIFDCLTFRKHRFTVVLKGTTGDHLCTCISHIAVFLH